jgi:hypothetical protein
MKNEEIYQDNFFKELIQKSDLETPSVSFTNGIMAGIQMAETKPYYLNIHKSTFYLIPALSIVVLSISWFLFPYFKDLILKYFDPFFVSFLKSALHNFSGLFQQVQISSTTIAIIISILGLFAFDVFFNENKLWRKYFFS